MRAKRDTGQTEKSSGSLWVLKVKTAGKKKGSSKQVNMTQTKASELAKCAGKLSSLLCWSGAAAGVRVWGGCSCHEKKKNSEDRGHLVDRKRMAGVRGQSLRTTRNSGHVTATFLKPIINNIQSPADFFFFLDATDWHDKLEGNSFSICEDRWTCAPPHGRWLTGQRQYVPSRWAVLCPENILCTDLSCYAPGWTDPLTVMFYTLTRVCHEHLLVTENEMNRYATCKNL